MFSGRRKYIKMYVTIQGIGSKVEVTGVWEPRRAFNPLWGGEETDC